MAEVIRRSVDDYLRGAARRDPEEVKRRARAVAGRFRSGLGDLSEHHDRYLADDLDK